MAVQITPEQLAKSGTEHAHQTALFCWASMFVNDATMSQRQRNAVESMFAIPNGGERNVIVAGKLKAEGVKSGVPDIFMPAPRYDLMGKNFHGLFIEMKHEKYRKHHWGGCSQEQMDRIESLRVAGYKVAVCYSWIEARDAILEYLK